jgi:plastocyanin
MTRTSWKNIGLAFGALALLFATGARPGWAAGDPPHGGGGGDGGGEYHGSSGGGRSGESSGGGEYRDGGGDQGGYQGYEGGSQGGGRGPSGESYYTPYSGGRETGSMSGAATRSMMLPRTATAENLNSQMRRLWTNHGVYSHDLVHSIGAGGADVRTQIGHLTENAQQVGDLIKPYYGAAAATKLSGLLTERANDTAALIQAEKSGDAAAISAAKAKWGDTANRLADHLSSLNPQYWQRDHLRDMFNRHLNDLDDEARHHFHGDWDREQEAFFRCEDDDDEFADLLTFGLIFGFPYYFGDYGWDYYTPYYYSPYYYTPYYYAPYGTPYGTPYGAPYNPPAPGVNGASMLVTMTDSWTFDPIEVDVNPGDTVRWQNNTDISHSVTVDEGNIAPGGPNSDSEAPNGVAPGHWYAWTVPADAAPGTRWYYHCRFHGEGRGGDRLGRGMAGMIVVQGGGAPAPIPPPGQPVEPIE